MDYLYDPDALYHFGVPGMKWGQRKARTANLSTANKMHAKAGAQNVKLANKIAKNTAKAAKFQKKADTAKYKLAKQTAFTEFGVAKRDKLMKKQLKNQAKADRLTNKTNVKLSAKIQQNKELQKTCQSRIKELNKQHVSNGKQSVDSMMAKKR